MLYKARFHRARLAAVAIAITIFSLGVNAGIAAETVYVTDKLLLGLFEKPDADAKQLRSLVSGTPLEVLERSGNYLKVRTPDGATGWAKNAYLVSGKPPRQKLKEAEAENLELERALREAEARLNGLRAEAEQMQQKLDRERAEGRAAETELVRLQTVVTDSDPETPHPLQVLPWLWWAAAAAALLLTGLLLGARWTDYRIRRRHGGFRLY